jgi:carboxypeptidase T
MHRGYSILIRYCCSSRRVIAALLLVCAAANGYGAGEIAHPRYSVVRVALGLGGDLRRLASLGIALEGGRLRDSSSVELLLDEHDVQKIRDAGFAAEIVVPDWHADYAARQKADMPASLLSTRARGFHLGSMGGFLTLAEVEADVDSMHARYPHLIGTRDSIGHSLEGRPIWGVRISGNTGSGGTLPCVLFTALHHAREPEGMMVLIYFMWYVLEQYGADEAITSLLDSREIYLVPVVNPDGYAYNMSTNPGGGGLWRKNRRANDDGSFGVDLNRNYGFQWGYDGIGSSPLKNDNDYRGAAPFSEPETQAIRDLCQRKKPTCALNYHAYANGLIHPWGYSDLPTRDSLFYRRLAEYLTAHNYYTYGTGGYTLGYVTNGDSDDWMYGDTELKPRIFALTPEVGNDADDGFWPQKSRILPLADANLEANIRMVQCAGQHFVVDPRAVDPIADADRWTVDVLLVNVGVPTQSTTATLRFESNDVEIVSPAIHTVALGESTHIPLVVQRKGGTVDGAKATVRVLCEFPGGRSKDSLWFRPGKPVVLLTDSADSTNSLWDAKSTGSLVTWGFTTRTAHSGAGCYADSPWGEYPQNFSSTYTLRQALPLFGTAAELRFIARWDIEPEYDFCLVEASRDSGRTWFSLPGRYTRRSSGASGGKQPAGGWGYDRSKDAWVGERIDLAPALGTRAMLRFRFESDGYVQRDGFFMDELQVLLYTSLPLAVDEPAQPVRMMLQQNYPNPFNPVTTIGFRVPDSGFRELAPFVRDPHPGTHWVKLAVYDLLGREVAVLVDGPRAPGLYSVSFNAEGLASGVYLCRFTAGAVHDVKKMVMMR